MVNLLSTGTPRPLSEHCSLPFQPTVLDPNKKRDATRLLREKTWRYVAGVYLLHNKVVLLCTLGRYIL